MAYPEEMHRIDGRSTPPELAKICPADAYDRPSAIRFLLDAGRGDMPEERYLRIIASAPLEEQAAVWKKHKPKKGEQAYWPTSANSLGKRQMFARDAKFGDAEQAAFGIVWTEDLFAPADEDSRYTTDVESAHV
jgi:hypothetical protein